MSKMNDQTLLSRFSNPYNYNLNEFGTIVVNQEGKIIGGFIDKLKFAKGNKFRFPIKGTMTLEVIDTKHLVIVKECKSAKIG